MSNQKIKESAPVEKSDPAREAAKELSNRAEKGVERTKEIVRHTVDAARKAGHELGQSAKRKGCAAVATTRKCAQRNPLCMILVAAAFGAAISYTIVKARQKPAFSERHEEDPLCSVRETILAALAPVSRRVQDGCGAVREGAGKAKHQAHRLKSRHASGSLADRIGRVGEKIKFW